MNGTRLPNAVNGSEAVHYATSRRNECTRAACVCSIERKKWLGVQANSIIKFIQKDFVLNEVVGIRVAFI